MSSKLHPRRGRRLRPRMPGRVAPSGQRRRARGKLLGQPAGRELAGAGPDAARAAEHLRRRRRGLSAGHGRPAKPRRADAAQAKLDPAIASFERHCRRSCAERRKRHEPKPTWMRAGPRHRAAHAAPRADGADPEAMLGLVKAAFQKMRTRARRIGCASRRADAAWSRNTARA